MSRHEGVSCDSCLIGNFRGRRYKCLICYDYDLCAACYEGGATNTRHTTDHPMQCIITRADFDLFYSGEALTNLELPQSFTCPYCSKMGFTDVTLQDHVTNDHADTSFEVVCPLCAAMPGGDPNLMTDDFASHLTLEHRSGAPRDLVSFIDEPVVARHGVRRMPHNTTSTPTGVAVGVGVGAGGGASAGGAAAAAAAGTASGPGGHVARGAASALRPRRSNMHFSVFSSGGLSSLSPSARETVDPITELLSQLSGVRRSTGNASSTPSQLQQLQMQLQLERQQVNAARQQLERFPRRQTQSQTLKENQTATNSSTNTLMLNPSPVMIHQPAVAPTVPQGQSQYLLSSLLEELSMQTTGDVSLDRSQFVRELILSSMEKKLEESIRDNINEDDDYAKKDTSVGLRGKVKLDKQNVKDISENNQAEESKSK